MTLVTKALKHEIKKLMDKSLRLKKTRDCAKTTLKRDKFTKRLHDNNNKIVQMLEYLEIVLNSNGCKNGQK